MEPAALAQINDELLTQAIAPWGGTRADVTLIRDFANSVYRVVLGGETAILRLTHSSHRDARQIQAELDWINYLATNGVLVCAPIATQDGRWLVELPVAEGAFVAVLWQMAPGGPAQVGDFGPELYRRMGQLVGQMHRLSVDYVVPAAAAKRFEWFEEDAPERLLVGLGAGDEVVRARLEQSWAEMRGWARGRDTYHLIHGDVHAGNFFLHQGQIHLFDFDDSCYHWRIYDIANALYYALWRIPRSETAQRTAFATEFMTHFLAGYRQEAEINRDEWQHLAFFLEYRDLLVYAYLRQMVTDQPEHEGLRQLLGAIRGRVEANQPYVGLDPQIVQACGELSRTMNTD